MPIVNVRKPKEVSKKQSTESVTPKDKGVKDQWFDYNSMQTEKSGPTRDPHYIGSSIVRRNEPDDED